MTEQKVTMRRRSLDGNMPCGCLSHLHDLRAILRTAFTATRESPTSPPEALGRTAMSGLLCCERFNWLWSGFVNPRIRTFVEKRFHRHFSKKKRSKSGGVLSFPRREHVLAVISLRSGQRSALHPFHEITWLLKIERIFCPRKLKNRSIFCLKNWSCDRRYRTEAPQKYV